MNLRFHDTATARFPIALGSILTLAISAAFAAPPASNVLPTGGQVVAGNAVISQAATRMTIDQSSAKAILNWSTFNIGSGASVNFNQPGASAVALNRILSSDPSAIHGQLSANGQVFLINPNGIIFGPGARVDVGGLVASTLSLSDTNFLDGRYRFSRDGATRSILNQGDLKARYVALLAPEVRNEGVITTTMGAVALAGGEAVTLNLTGQDLVDIQVEKASIDTLVSNQRLIQADGGTVILAAQSAQGLIGQVVNTGQVEANGVANDGGTIRLTASTTLANSGTVSANAADRGKGGTIVAIADLANPDSRTVVDGTWSATGGRVSGDGGFIETSANHLAVRDSATISTLAPHGRAGQWLLDPNDFTIAAAGGDITGAALTAALAGGNVTITTTAGNANCVGVGGCTVGTAGNGDINVNTGVTIGAGNYLTLSAYRNINFNAQIAVNSNANTRLYLWYGMKGAGQPGAIVVNAGGGTTGEGNNIKGGNFNTEAAHTYPIIGNLVYTPPNIDAYVLASSGTSVYGDTPGFSYGIYDSASGGIPLGLSPAGSVAWSTPLTATTNAGSYSLTYTGSFSLSGYAFHPGTAATWTITPRQVTANVSKTYDGTTAFNSGFVISNLANNDTLSISGNSSSANAGTYNNLSSLRLGNSNYSLSSVAATIVPAPVTLTATRVYDGSPDLGSRYAYTSIATDIRSTGKFPISIRDRALLRIIMNTSPEELKLLPSGQLESLVSNGLVENISSFHPATLSFNYTQFTVFGPTGAPQPQLASGTASVSSTTPGTYTSFVNNNLVLSDSQNYTLNGAQVSATITKATLGIAGLPAQAAQGYPLASSAYTYGVTSPAPQGNTVLPMPWSSFVTTNPGLISGVPSFNISAISASTLPGTYSIPVGKGSLTSNFFDFTFAPASLTVLAIPKLGNLIQNVFDTNRVTIGVNRLDGDNYETWRRATGIASGADSNTVKETLKQILSSDGLGVTVVYGKTSYGQGRITRTMSSLTDAVNAVLRSQCPPCNPIGESTLSTWIYGS